MENYKQNYNRYKNTIDFLNYLYKKRVTYRIYNINDYIPQELSNDETFYKGIAEDNPLLFKDLSSDWLRNPNNFKKIIEANPYVYHYCSYVSKDFWKDSEISDEFKRITGDYNIMMEKVKNYGRCLQDVSYEFMMKNNCKMLLEAVKNDYRVFMDFAPKELQALLTRNKEFILDSFLNCYSDLFQVKMYAVMLNNLSDEFKNDNEVIKKAVSECGLTLKYLQEDNKNNEDYVKIAVTQNGLALRYASEELKNNPEIVKSAVSQNGLALRYASEELKNNPGIVKSAVSQNGLALKYASEELKNNKESAQLAVDQNKLALKSATKELRNNYQINVPIEALDFSLKVFWELKKNKINDLLQLIEFRNDEKFGKMTKKSQKEILEILERYKNKTESEEEYKDITDEIEDEISDDSSIKEGIRLIAKELVKHNDNYGVEYWDLPENLREDTEVTTEAIKYNPGIFRSIPEDREDYYDIVLESVKSGPYLMNHIPEDMQKSIGNDYDTMMTMVKKSEIALHHASEDLKNDRELVIEAIKNYGGAIRYASEELRNDPEIVLMALRQNGNALEDIPEYFLNNKEIVIEAAKNGLSFEKVDSFLKKKLKERGYLDDPDFKLEMAKNGYNEPRIFIEDPLIIADAKKIYQRRRIEDYKEVLLTTEEERNDFYHGKYKEIINKKIAIDNRRYKEETLLKLQQENFKLNEKISEMKNILDNSKETDNQK
ncbi:MAG: DUF4116 domain-containing protein [Clostridia bacterium]|nr:DUF4116 domain-containing protein [Clostridia bacterium]